MTMQHTVEDEVEHRVNSVDELPTDAPTIRLNTRPGGLVTGVTEAGQDVQIDRHRHLTGSVPKWIVMLGCKRQLRMGDVPDKSTLQPHVGAALQLLDGILDVISGDTRNAHKPAGCRRAILDKPVVVDAEARFLKLTILYRKLR